MKKCLIIFFALLILTSCVTIPEPKSSDEVLVIGRLLLDFPDGYFDKPAQVINNSITVVIYNKTSDVKITRTTDDGYFSFVANTGDEIEIIEYYYRRESNRQITTLGSALGLEIDIIDKRINYTGDMIITYAAGKIVEVDGRDSTYSYKRSLKISDKTSDAKEYLQIVIPESEWLSYDVQKIEFNS